MASLLRTTSVEPVPQEILDIIDKINEGKDKFSDLEGRIADLERQIQIDNGQRSDSNNQENRVPIQETTNDREPEIQETGIVGENPNKGNGNQQQANVESEAKAKPDYSRMSSVQKFRIKKRPLWTWDEVEAGMFVYLKYNRKYFSYWHAVLVTGTDPANSVLQGIHYAWESLRDDREVSEDEFNVDISKHEVWQVHVPDERKVSAEEAVSRGRKMVGEKNYKKLTRRSRHVVLDCVLKN